MATRAVRQDHRAGAARAAFRLDLAVGSPPLRRRLGLAVLSLLPVLLFSPLVASAASLGTWQAINVGKPAKAFVTGIAYGNGMWVAVGQGGFISTSPDGKKWTKRSAGISRDFNDVTFSRGRFIAVCKAPDADTGTGAKIWTSDDKGAKWTFRNTDAGLNSISVGLHAVASDGNGNLVAVGGVGWVTRSFDNGNTWHVLMPPARFTVGSLYGVGYGNGQWIATLSSGGIYRSTDGGANWTTVSTSLGSTHVAFGNGRFLLADNQHGNLLWSADGTTWKLATAAAGGATSFTYAKGCVFSDGLFVAVTEYGDIWTSENGRQFKQWRAAGGDPDAWCIGAGNGIFIAAGGDFALTYGTAWISPPWLKARTGSTWDYPYTAFDAEDGLPKKIGLPEYRINTASLNLVLEATLLYLRTLGSPVNMRLVYSSAPTPSGASTIGIFGKNWRFRYESVVSAFGTEAKVMSGGGRSHLYGTPNGQDLSTATTVHPLALVPPDGVFDELTFYGPDQYFELREKGTKVVCRYAVSGGPGNAIWRLTHITDRSGNQITLDVDGASGRISSITDPAGRVVTLSYDTVRNLCTGITAPDGRRVTFTYDMAKNLTGITDMAGYAASYVYDDLGFLTQMTTAGRQNRFTYSDRPGFETGTGDPEAAGDRVVAAVTNATGQVTRYELLPGNTGMKRTDAKGGVTVFSSSAGQTAQVTDPLGSVSQMEYSTAKLPASYTDSAGKTTTFRSDARGNLILSVDALGNQTSMTYDSRDNLASRTDALGKTWLYTYDDHDRVTSARTPLLNTTRFSYFSTGRLRLLRDARDQETAFDYDVYGNLLRVTDPLTHSVRFAYDPMGLHCTSLTDPCDRTKSMQYDHNDRLTTVRYDSVVGAPQRVNTYDAFGQTSLTDELGELTAVTRNEFGYLTSVTDPLGNTTSNAYDPSNNPVSFTDALGRVTTTTYDAANRPLVITDALGKTVKREYDAEGNLLSLTDARNSKTAFKYDANHRLIETRDPLLRAVALSRDALGRAATTTNARGQAVRHTYDDDGRILTTEYRETAAGSFIRKAAFTYDPNGNPISRLDDWGTTTTTYDARNQPLAVTYPTGKTASFTYTAAGQLASISYPTGLVVTYAYDDFNRLAIPARLRNAAGAELQGNHERPSNITRLGMALDGETAELEFAYDPAGNRLSDTRPNSTSTTYEYDAAQRVTRVLHHAGAEPLLQSELAYDGVGSVVRETTSGGAYLAPGLPAADTVTYNACNQVISRNGKAYTYDADGNLTAIAGGEFSATYTAENRPSQITRTRDAVLETIQYTYDAAGLRVKRVVVGGATSQFHYGPDARLLFTTTAAGEVTATYIWKGNTLVAVLTEGSLSTGIRYLHLNRLGHVVALTDASGANTTKCAYQPHGATYRETLSAGGDDPTLFGFVGGLGVQDEGGGLFYMKNRFYDASSGRFLQRDPIGFEGGSNLYAYVGNRPTNAVDPEGLVRDEMFLCAPEDRYKGLYDPTLSSAAAAVFHKTVKEYLLKTPGKVVYDAARGKSAAEIAVSLLVKSPLKNLVAYGLGVAGSGGWSIVIGLGIDAAEPAVTSALGSAAGAAMDSADDAIEAIEEAPGAAKEAFWNYTETGSVLGDLTNPEAAMEDGF